MADIAKYLSRVARLIAGRGKATTDAPAVTAAVGLWGEQQAERFLKRAGFRILSRRLRIGRRDELDIVARDGEILVFVEVKTRANEKFGRPFAAVTARKRRALSRAAVRYLRMLRTPMPCFRFDVVEVIGQPNETPRNIRHIQNAFPLDRKYRVQ